VTGRVDIRPVLARLADIVEAAAFDLTHDEPVDRCDCGASLLRPMVGGFVCAGCGLLPSYYRLHPAQGAHETTGDGERGVPAEMNAAGHAARKVAEALVDTTPVIFPAGSPGSGDLGRSGVAPRSLRLLSNWRCNWGLVWGLVFAAAFWVPVLLMARGTR